jgi:beta-galactosidase
MVQETSIRAGRKATMAERITQRGRLPNKYLLPVENDQVKADIQSRPIDGGEELTFTLTPDTADVFRAELGLAYLLDARIDRVQWIGQGPFASYPGRHQANRYGFWAKQMDDLYFEGNHGGVDAAFFSDKEGNGILIVGDSLNLNFEQTDRGIVVTVNAAVSGQGPKFAKTAFNGWKPGDGPVSASFRIYRVEAGQTPSLFIAPHDVPAPFHPFATQYDTYLLKYNNIKSAE